MNNPVDLQYSCEALFDTSFVEKYHKKFKVAKHQISPIFKDAKNKYSNP